MSDASPKMKDLDALIRRTDGQQALTPMEKGPNPLAGSVSTGDQIREQKLSLFGRFQAGAIERKMFVETIKSIHATQLESTKHKLMRALEVDKKRVDVVAERLIADLNQEYLRDMQVMHVQNFQQRSEMLIALGKSLTTLLSSAATAEMPESIRAKTIDGIMKKYEHLYDKLLEEFRLGN